MYYAQWYEKETYHEVQDHRFIQWHNQYSHGTTDHIQDATYDVSLIIIVFSLTVLIQNLTVAAV